MGASPVTIPTSLSHNKGDNKKYMKQGNKLAGANPERGRVENDYYATHPDSTKALLKVEEILYPALEPACGAGHIAKLLDESKTDCFDLVDRGYGIPDCDFLATDFLGEYNTVITNPPFNLFTEFMVKGLKITKKKLIMFGKLQALEGVKRAGIMEKTPLKTVYVFKKRQQPLRDGKETDNNGKKLSSTMAFAWFVWEKDYQGNPLIKWI